MKILDTGDKSYKKIYGLFKIIHAAMHTWQHVVI